MDYSFFGQAKQMLLDKKYHKRWLSVFLLLAMVVSIVTVEVFKYPSVAMTDPERILNCQYTPHQHDASCYDEAGQLICGLADYAVHYHTEDCYGASGQLICPLPEIGVHFHDDSCYTEESVLACGLEESEGHVHTEACYSRVQGELLCADESEEHVHTDECYAWTEELSCGLEEGEGAHSHDESCYETRRTLTCTEQTLHVHDASCYDEAGNRICGLLQLEAHTHSDDCFRLIEKQARPESDPTADVETEAEWTAAFAGLTLSGNWDEDLLMIARSQLGYHESEKNFVMDEDGVQHGWTRYGAWYGLPYDLWCAMFISFCLNYANVPETAMPRDIGTVQWVDKLRQQGLYTDDGSYLPKPGDLVFYEFNGAYGADHVGIVSAVDGEQLEVIEGNSGNAVSLTYRRLSDPEILGFGVLPENPLKGIDPAAYPAQRFEAAAGDVTVTVEADVGAFPAGTTMVVELVEDQDVITSVAGAVEGQVKRVHAVDISFFDADGNEIEPRIPIRVSMSPAEAAKEEETPVVVHLDAAGETSLMEQSAPDGSEAAAENAIVFEADSFSVYALVYTEITTRYLTADGHTYEITLQFEPEAEIPADAKLNVSEVRADTVEYQSLLTAAAQQYGAKNNEIGFARFFDIEILSPEGEKVEPAASVTVRIRLADIPEEEDFWQIVHFGEEGTELIQPAREEEQLQFEAASFSVYGAITAPAPTGVNDLNGRSFTLNIGGNYLTNQTLNENPTKIGKTNNADNAAVWNFESTGNGNEFRIYTMVDGAKQYLEMTRVNGQSANAALSSSPSTVNVRQNNDGSYTIYKNINGTNYYLNQYGGNSGSGYAGWNGDDNNNHMRLTSTQPTMESGGRYMALVEYPNAEDPSQKDYYIINNNGTLSKVDYDGTYVYVEDPMLWVVDGSGSNQHVWFESEASGFNYQDTAADYFRRYLDPSQEEAITTEHGNEEGNPANVTLGRYPGDNVKTGYMVTNRNNMLNQTSVSYSNNTLSHSGKYLGVELDEDGTPVAVKGNQSAANAATIVFADASKVLSVGVSTHTVDHIDISISGKSSIKVPLAYGTYYYKDGSGNWQEYVVTTDTSLNLDQDVAISAEDMKGATIKAYDVNGNELDNAFVVTGYSSNASNAYSTVQVRIGGRFKVADTYEGGGNDAATKARRLANKITYEVSAIKSLTYDLEDEDHGQLYEKVVAGDGTVTYEPMSVTVDVDMAASFDYWDERNECPGIKNEILWGSHDQWVNGGIPNHNLSGMDFVLGGDADEANSQIVAIEITKLIVDESGHRIKPVKDVHNSFTIYQDLDGNFNSVVGVNAEAYTAPFTQYGDYTERHGKTISVGQDGMGLVFDYNVVPGMYYIQEDKNSIPDTITDISGEEWTYRGTRIETEYVWRENADYTGKMHVGNEYDKSSTEADAFKSIPEVLGNYTGMDGKNYWVDDHGQQRPLRNGFLEFYVYNIYEQSTELKVEKQWEGDKVAEGASIDVTIKRYKLVPDGSITPDEPTTASLTIQDSFTGLGGDRTYSATYRVTGPEGYDQTFTGSGSSITIPDLPFGEYTVTKTATEQDGYDAENRTGSQTVTLGAVGATVRFPATEYTRQNQQQQFYRVRVYANDTLNQGNQHIGDNGHFTYVDAEYPAGSSLTFSMGVPAWNNNSSYSFTRTGASNVSVPAGQTRSQTFTLTGDTDIVVYGSTPYYGMDANHPYGQWLDPTPSITVNSVGFNALSPVRSMAKAPALAAASEGTAYPLVNNGGLPEVEDHSWQEDSTWMDGEGLIVHLPDENGSWYKWVEDLEQRDGFGNVYAYYIAEVREQNLPAGTTGQIIMDGDDKALVYGDHYRDPDGDYDKDRDATLYLKNIVAEDEVGFEVTKVWKDEQGNTVNKTTPVTFKLFQVGYYETTDENGDPVRVPAGEEIYKVGGVEQVYTVTPPAVCTVSGLPQWEYKTVEGETRLVYYEYRIVEDPVPAGYRADIDQESHTIVNTPVKPAEHSTPLDVSKTWLDQDGEPAPAALHDGDSIQFKLIQNAVKLEDIYPVTVLYTAHGQQIQEDFFVAKNTNLHFTFTKGRTLYSHYIGVRVNDGAESQIGGTGTSYTYNTGAITGPMTLVFDQKFSYTRIFGGNTEYDNWAAQDGGSPVEHSFSYTWGRTMTRTAGTLYRSYQQMYDAVMATDPTLTPDPGTIYTLTKTSVSTETNPAPYTVASDNNWGAKFTKLPQLQKVGNDYYIYTYEVAELTVNGGSVSAYTGTDPDWMGQTDAYLTKWEQDEDGNWIITNRERSKSISFTKLWKNVDGVSVVWPEGNEIQVEITRWTDNGEGVPAKDESFSLKYVLTDSLKVGDSIAPTGAATPVLQVTAAGTDNASGYPYSFLLEGLKKTDSQGREYVYRITETSYPTGYLPPTYSGDQPRFFTTEGGSITNQVGKALPSTGSIGTASAVPAGAVLSAAAAACVALRALRRRKKERK